MKNIGTHSIMAVVCGFLLVPTGCSNPQREFEAALQINTEQAFQVFIEKHPDGPYAAKARVILDKVAVRKLDSDYAATHKRAADKVTTDQNQVDELSRKNVPVTMQAHLGSRPGEPMIWMREEPDEAAAAELEADRKQAATHLAGDKEALETLEADYVAAHRQALAKLEGDKRLVSDPEFLSHLGDQYGTNTVVTPHSKTVHDH